MKNLAILVVMFFSLVLSAQTNPCKKKLGEGFYPLNYNFEKNQSNGDSGEYFIEEVADTIRFKSVTYSKFIAESAYTGKDLLLHRDKDTIWRLDPKEMLEHVYFIDKQEKGIKWNASEIVKVKAKVVTPYCEHEDLMQVREKSRSGKVIDKYYQEGLGLVAKKVDGLLVQYYIPEFSEMKATHPKYGDCEDSRCTLLGVVNFVQDKMKQDGFVKSFKGRGNVVFQVNISENGSVSGVEILKSTSQNKKDEQKVKTYFQSLPDFTPAQHHAFRTRDSKIKIQLKM